jgi:hypothetical protein
MLLYFLVLLVHSTNSCSVNPKELSQIESKYTIDLDGKQEAYVPFSAYFKSPKTIILETDKDCLIGHISEFQVFDGHIYILDKHIAKGMLVFDTEGRFIRKIGSLGQGPGEYILPSDFSLDTENRFVFLLDFGQRVHKYRFDGTFVQTIIPKMQKANISHIQYHNKRLYISTLSFKPSSNDKMLLEIDIDNGEILSQYLPLKYNKGWAEPFLMDHNLFIPRLNAPPLYTQLFMDYIVSIEGNITPYIEIKSKNLVNAKDLMSVTNNSGDASAKTGGYKRLLREDFSKVWNVHSYVENGEFILFRYRQGSNNTVIFHKKTETVKLVKDFCNDLKLKNDDNRFWGGFVFSDSKGAYEILQNTSIELFLKSIRNNEVVPGLDKKDELLRLNEESNPVIFYYEFK